MDRPSSPGNIISSNIISLTDDYEDESIQVSFRVLSDGILAIRFKKTDVPVSDTGTVLDNLEVYKMDFIKFQNEMPEYYLGQISFYKNEEDPNQKVDEEIILQ